MTQAGNLLRAAKSLISDPKDWTQTGVYSTIDGCMCAKGAFYRTFWASDYNVDVSSDAQTYLHKAVRNLHPYHLVTTYNDDPNTTHADIMKLFDDAATMADTPT